MGVAERVHADLVRGEPWLARDRLTGALGQSPTDTGLLTLLARARTGLNDLPAAGAAWFLTDRADHDVEAQAALRAFHERYPKAPARAHALPMSMACEPRRYPPQARRRIDELREELHREGWHWEPPLRPVRRDETRSGLHVPVGEVWWGRLGDLGWGGFGLANLALWVLGVVTAIRWLF